MKRINLIRILMYCHDKKSKIIILISCDFSLFFVGTFPHIHTSPSVFVSSLYWVIFEDEMDCTHLPIEELLSLL